MTIVGVTPEGFIGSFLGVSASAWVPMAMQREMMGGDRMTQRGNGWMQSLVRLKPGVSQAQAQAEATSIMTQLAQEHPQFNEGRRLRIVQTWEAPFGAATVLTPILAVLSILVALVLVIACANVANLLLSKAVSRRREVAVRLSLGASRTRLVRQLLTESLLLAFVAGTAGVVMAYWTMDLIMAFVPPVDMPIDLGLRMDSVTLMFAVGVSLVTGRDLRARAGAAGVEPADDQRLERGRPQRQRRAHHRAAAQRAGRGRRSRYASCCSSARRCFFAASSPRRRCRRALTPIAW